MQRALGRLFVALIIGVSSVGAFGQSEGSNQGQPMGATPQPDTSRMQEEMHHAIEPAGPLKITFGDKADEWTPTTLAPLPHTTITVYNEHAKTNQTFTGVPLINLLARLGVPDKPRGKDFGSILWQAEWMATRWCIRWERFRPMCTMAPCWLQTA